MKEFGKRMIDFLKKICFFLTEVYSIISVLSTLTIFSALVLFLIGKFMVRNICDDDLTMQKIQEQMPDNLSISSIYMEDIHGFGNESIIILASDSEVGNEIANQLLIFDKVDNDILNKINNLYGYGSNYKLSYSFSLEYLDKKWSELGYLLEIVDIVDLTDDISKEIVVRFMPMDEWGSVGGNGGYYETGIFSYSYDKHTYYLLGTYPSYDDDRSPKSESYERNYYNANEKFCLEQGLSKFYNEYFAKDDWSVVLVRTELIMGEGETYYDPHRYTISVFRPMYDTSKDELKWEVQFSKDTDDCISECSKDFVRVFLEENGISIGDIEN